MWKANVLKNLKPGSFFIAKDFYGIDRKCQIISKDGDKIVTKVLDGGVVSTQSGSSDVHEYKEDE